MEQPLAELSANLQLDLSGHILVVGKTGAGKTYLTMRLLREASKVWQKAPAKVIIRFQTYQPIYAETKEAIEAEGQTKVELVEGVQAKLSDFPAAPSTPNDAHTILVIDDGSIHTSSSTEIAHLIVNARPRNVIVLLIWHAIYFNNPIARLVSSNVSYLFLLPSVRLNSQVATLDAQMQFHGLLRAAYAHICDEEMNPDRYLFVDLSSNVPSILRLRSKITSEAQTVFLRQS